MLYCQIDALCYPASMAEGSASSPFHTPMFRAVILQGCREKRRGSFDGELYKKCNRVERLVGGSSSADASSPAKR